MIWEREAAAAARAEAEMLDRERHRNIPDGDVFYATVYGAKALRDHAKRLDELEALRREARGHDRARRLLAWILKGWDR